MEADIKPSRVKITPRRVFLWRKGKWDDLRHSIESFSQEYLDMDKTSKSCNELWISIKSHLNNAVKKLIPTKNIKPHPGVPWVDDEIRKLMRRRERHRSRTKHRRFDPQVSAKSREFKKSIQKKIRQKYWAYVKDVVLGLADPDHSDGKSNSTKRFYSYLKSLRSETSGIAPLKVNGKLISNSEGKATALNNQFVSVFSQDTGAPVPDLGPSSHADLPPIHVSPEGVCKLLSKILPHKAAGPDEIHARVLRELHSPLAPVLSDLFQRSLDSGEVPEDWKEANVAPVFKKGDKNRASNYRPISLTSIVCKLLEHIVASHTMSHLEQRNALYTLQHGFRKRRSCETQLLSLYQDLTQARDNKIQTDIVVMDFAKAFDKVSHRHLAAKLDYYEDQC